MELDPTGNTVDGLTLGGMVEQIRAVLARGAEDLGLLALESLVGEIQKRRSERTLTMTPPASGAGPAVTTSTPPPTFQIGATPLPPNLPSPVAHPRESCLATRCR